MKKILSYLLLSGILFFVGCDNSSKNNGNANKGKKMKVGFITVGPTTDWGYNTAHNMGKRYIDSVAGDKFETSIVEQIPENAEVERVMERMISEGVELIFPTSYGYLDPALRVAQKHKNVKFMHCGGYKTADNLGTYFAYIHEPMYLAGIAAGKMTKTNKLGFVAAFPIPQVLRNINAFTLGARSVNPNVKVNVIWTNNWYDPATEAEATKTLVKNGADVISMHQDSPKTVVETAEASGAMSVGYHVDVKQFAPKGWLTGARWDWGKLYLKLAEQVKDGSWKSEQIREHINSGYVDISDFGPAMTEEAKKAVLDAKQALMDGSLQIFKAPLKDNAGNIVLKEGQAVDFDWMESTNYYVEGVEGNVPKK